MLREPLDWQMQKFPRQLVVQFCVLCICKMWNIQIIYKKKREYRINDESHLELDRSNLFIYCLLHFILQNFQKKNNKKTLPEMEMVMKNKQACASKL